jgi:hypothetical protein
MKAHQTKHKKIKFSAREIGMLINQKYNSCTVKLLHESQEAYIMLIHNITPTDAEPIVCIYYTSEEIPFQNSFDFFTKNKYFAVPI